MDPRIERTQRIVREAALDELAAAGYGAFAIDAVARRAGVARSTIYRHWPDKLALISDAMETLNVQPGPPADEVSRDSPVDRVEALLRHFAEAMRGSLFSACMPALVEAADRHPELARFLHEYSARRRRALVDAVADGVAAGAFRPGLDPDLASLALVGPILYRRVLTSEPFDATGIGDLMKIVLGSGDPHGA